MARTQHGGREPAHTAKDVNTRTTKTTHTRMHAHPNTLTQTRTHTHTQTSSWASKVCVFCINEYIPNTINTYYYCSYS